MSDTIDAQVLVVGGGPIGLVTAYTLAHYGVPCLLVERNENTTLWPKMDITNVRSMEILRRLGLSDGLREEGVTQNHRLDTIVTSGLGIGGKVITTIDLPSPDELREIIREQNDGSMPREPYQRCSQAIFEAWVRTVVEKHPLIESHWSTALETLVEEPEGVVATLLSGTTTRKVRVRYVVGCDGATSRVRKTIDIGLTGGPMTLRFYLVHFKSKDLTRIHAQGQFWHMLTTSGGIVIAQDEVDTWTTHLAVPLEFDVSQLSPKQAVYKVFGGVTGEYPIEIDQVLVSSVWTPHTAVADQYISSGGRVLLAGDSAHQNIPTGGYGFNTGIGDAFDIGWKLPLVLSGIGGAQLLNSYEQERRPVALYNVERASFHSGNSRHWLGMAIKAGPEKMLLKDPDGLSMHSQIKQYIDANDGVNKERGTELDYRLRSSPAIVTEESAEPLHDPRQYTPSTFPGCRAPHVFLQDGERSIFDLYGPYFTIVDFSPAGVISARLAKIAGDKKIPLSCVHLPNEFGARKIWERDVVLVRPDGYVAWRSTEGEEVYGDVYFEKILLTALGH